MYDECYCGEDDRDQEQEIASSMARGKSHEVTVDVTVRTTITVPGAFHDLSELEDLVSETDLCAGEVQNVEEVG